jgi:hypothetical protein
VDRTPVPALDVFLDRQRPGVFHVGIEVFEQKAIHGVQRQRDNASLVTAGRLAALAAAFALVSLFTDCAHRAPSRAALVTVQATSVQGEGQRRNATPVIVGPR